jgi:hypothetical protein
MLSNRLQRALYTQSYFNYDGMQGAYPCAPGHKNLVYERLISAVMMSLSMAGEVLSYVQGASLKDSTAVS